MVTVETVEFTVPFVAGKERSRVCRRGGKIHQYTPKTTQANMNIIRKAFTKAVEDLGIDVSLEKEIAIEINAYALMPKTRPKHIKWETNMFKPDADNIAKLVMDALNGVAYKDDKQITELYVRKHERQRKETDSTTEFMQVHIHWLERNK